ncbi:hypothetical protein ACFVSN_17175 [Kitasatospora sp. NPDC057904]|uniref:hypothetical protein n=1 Tax=Kitasatospora sp. NPDC057904 TaxID=3346275 RepID=UPI0036DBAB1A
MAVLVAAAAYVLAIWLAAWVQVPFGPNMEADRWVVDAGFATVVSAAALAWAGWWAGREPGPGGSQPGGSYAGRDSFITKKNRFHGPANTGSGPQTNYFNASPRSWIIGMSSVAAIAMVVVVVVYLTQPRPGVPEAKDLPASSTSTAEGLSSNAAWCCAYTSVPVSTGFYWPGTVDALNSALAPTGPGTNPATLTPGGLGLIEIQLQTSDPEPILVEPPKVVVQAHGPNLTTGMLAILPLGGQGGGTAGQFEADVDAVAPVTRPVGATNSTAANYQYVSAGSAEVMTLFISDTNCDCTFDVELTWLERGVTHTSLLTNGGRHFRVVGSEGLPWYAGDPRGGGKLARVSGQPFSSYAPTG